MILTRKPGESLYIGDDVKVTIVEIKGHQIRVGIEAPKEYRIYREEIYLTILEENRKAAQALGGEEMAGLENISEAWRGRVPAPTANLEDSGGVRGSADSAAHLKPSRPGAQKPAPRPLEVVIRRKRGKQDE